MEIVRYDFSMPAFSSPAKLYKERAIMLRKKGLSYREILVEIPVAKSTLTEWFKTVGLTVAQKQRLT
jgi:hypothetical protein